MSEAVMNAEQLLDLYDRVADSTDAIEHLRRFVLNLAVRGKLVEQDPNDEPATELIERLAVGHKTSPSKNKQKSVAFKAVPLSGDLFALPQGWQWTPLASISDVTMGQSPPGDSYNKSGDGVPLINGPVEFSEGPFGSTVVNQSTTAPTKFCEEGDLLICVRGSTTGRTNVAAFRACIGRGVAAIRSSFDDTFIRLFIWKSRQDIIAIGRGIAFPSVSKKQLENLAIPLPPLAEQHRIVAKAEELMALLDRLEETRMAAETTRDRLTALSLSRLTAPDTTPEAFLDHVRFALDALPKLTARADQIASLRQSILDLAVRGKLVEQDPDDEPASELLERIKAEKDRLVREGKFKTLEETLDRDPASFPFSIPISWSWCYLDDISAVARGGSPRPIKSFLTDDPDGIPWIKIGDSKRGSIYIDQTAEKIKPEGLAKSRLVIPGDLLLSNSMSFGFPYITNVEGCIHDGWLVIRTPEGLVDKLYLHKVFLSNHATATFSDAASGAVVQNLNADKARQLSLPLPPLAEQHRIVAKVDELMALCERMEAALANTDTTKQRLLEALLHDALAGDAPNREAA